jgi:hypothetical protein
MVRSELRDYFDLHGAGVTLKELLLPPWPCVDAKAFPRECLSRRAGEGNRHRPLGRRHSSYFDAESAQDRSARLNGQEKPFTEIPSCIPVDDHRQSSRAHRRDRSAPRLRVFLEPSRDINLKIVLLPGCIRGVGQSGRLCPPRKGNRSKTRVFRTRHNDFPARIFCLDAGDAGSAALRVHTYIVRHGRRATPLPPAPAGPPRRG